MKTFKILFAAIIIAGFAGSAFAQEFDKSADATATAQILQQLDIEKNEDIDFGTILDGTTATLDPRNGGSIVNFDEVFNVGKFTISGPNGQNIIINFDETVTLEGLGDDLTLNTDVIFNDEDDDAEAADLNTGGSATLSGSGSGFVWVGGNITVPGGQTAGEYAGTFNISVEYN